MPDKDEQIQNDHDLLIRIDTRLQYLIRDNNEYKINLARLDEKKINKDYVNLKIKELEKGCNEKFTDHEKRMRKIERFVYIMTGALLILEIILKKT